MNAATRRPSPLRAARLRAGLTQERAAVAAGISLAWLRQLELNPERMTPRIAARLLPVLGLAPPAAPAPEAR